MCCVLPATPLSCRRPSVHFACLPTQSHRSHNSLRTLLPSCMRSIMAEYIFAVYRTVDVDLDKVRSVLGGGINGGGPQYPFLMLLASDLTSARRQKARGQLRDNLRALVRQRARLLHPHPPLAILRRAIHQPALFFSRRPHRLAYWRPPPAHYQLPRPRRCPPHAGGRCR